MSVGVAPQIFFGQTDHFHDGIAVDAVFQHGTGNFAFAFIAAFFNTALFTQLQALVTNGAKLGLPQLGWNLSGQRTHPPSPQ